MSFEAHPVGTAGLIIGRNPPRANGVQIDDGRASRKHASIEWVGGANAHSIRDLKSTNGTTLNGVEIEREFLQPSDVIRVGSSLFVYCQPAPEGFVHDETIVGRSRAIADAIESIRQVGPTDLTVLVMGETGTGKELAARALHEASGRTGAFVPVNCGAFPATLIESELFGYVKGAFSGAERAKDGLIASAHGGTLFFDEIGEFPVELQPRLLRVLQDREVRPVGATTSKLIDVRFVAATNQAIFAMVEKGDFRRDLLARLNEWPVTMPPLTERREDLGLLIRHFLQLRDCGSLADELPVDLIERMLRAPWQSNIRELASATARLAVSARSREERPLEVLEKLVFGDRLDPLSSTRVIPPQPGVVELNRVIALYDGNISGVARYFGKQRQQVYRWMERHGIEAT
jgi:transcriptional regulator with PAS, ATPase and Fis domain